MRVMQLIDSLELGGAERMAVSYANMLSQEIEASYLCSTREEGPLKESVFPEVHYCFLNRQKTLDLRAVKKAVAIIKEGNIDIIHAHGTSYFFAYLIQLKHVNVKVIWHNHHGASKDYGFLKKGLLQRSTKNFQAIITVNNELKKWVEKTFKFPPSLCHYIPNFVDFSSTPIQSEITMAGAPSERIICLANLKKPKEHFFLCKAFLGVHKKHPQATLHFVGKDFQDAYSDKIKAYREEHKLQEAIFIHGQQQFARQFLEACAIGVLASSSEGLPMALLEYGSAGLAVITTNVGECKAVVQGHGLIVSSGNLNEMQAAIEKLLVAQKERVRLAHSYRSHIERHYSQRVIRNQVLGLYSKVYKS